MNVFIRAAAFAAALGIAPAASATPLCDSLKSIIAAMDASPMFSGIARAENNRPVGKIVPDGWLRCTIGQYEETTGRYTCYGPGGAPQATELAHLAEVRAELTQCFGVNGTPPSSYGGQDNELDFVIRSGGDPVVTILTYTEGAGQPDGGIRFSVEFTHPS